MKARMLWPRCIVDIITNTAFQGGYHLGFKKPEKLQCKKKKTEGVEFDTKYHKHQILWQGFLSGD